MEQTISMTTEIHILDTSLQSVPSSASPFCNFDIIFVHKICCISVPLFFLVQIKGLIIEGKSIICCCCKAL